MTAEVTRPFCTSCGSQASEGRYCAHCGAQVQPEVPEPQELDDSEATSADWWGRIERAFSFRVAISALFCGAVAGVLASFLWEGLATPVTLVVAALIWVGTVLNDDQQMKCPRCRKRVKLGADTCHHCSTYTGA